MPQRNLGMKNLFEDLECLYDARTGPVEVRVAIGEIDASGQRTPIVPVKLAFGARDVEPARRDDHDIGLTKIVPVLEWQVDASRAFDQLGRPAAGRHQRLDPLDTGDARTRLGPEFTRHARLQRVHDFLATLLDAERARHSAEVLPDVRQ